MIERNFNSSVYYPFKKFRDIDNIYSGTPGMCSMKVTRSVLMCLMLLLF